MRERATAVPVATWPAWGALLVNGALLALLLAAATRRHVRAGGWP